MRVARICSMQKLSVSLLVLSAVLSAGFAYADDPADAVLTNTAQLAEAGFNHALYLPWFSPSVWQAFPTDGQPIWIDLSGFSTDFAALWTNAEEGAFGIRIVRIRITRSVLTGEAVIETDDSGEQIASVSAPADYQPDAGQNGVVLRMWNEAKEWDDTIEPPVVTTRVTLADANDLAAYLAAQEAEWAEQSASSSSSGIRMGFGGGGYSMLMTRAIHA